MGAWRGMGMPRGSFHRGFVAAVMVTLAVLVVSCGDQSVREVGQLDAGLPDGGIDGGPSDGGPLDGGPSDGGPIDGPIDPSPPEDLVQICGIGRVPESLEEWETCYTKRKCEWQVSCVPLNVYSNVDECIAWIDAVEGGRLLAERRERARVAAYQLDFVDRDSFVSCLRETKKSSCTTPFVSAACAQRFNGQVEEGGVCYSDSECDSPGAVCSRTCADACCPGTCQRKFREGEACTGFYSCEPGLQCHGVCIAGDIGTACTSMRDCDPNAWCDVGAGRCKADLPIGTSCTSILQCGGDASCIGLSIVDAKPGRCLRTSQRGDPCGSTCYGNLYCDSGKCMDLPDLGASCSALTPCKGVNSSCLNGLCAPRGEIGERCSSSASCRSGLFCTSEIGDSAAVCAAPGGPDTNCSNASHCESYRCSSSGVCLDWSNSCPAAETF